MSESTPDYVAIRDEILASCSSHPQRRPLIVGVIDIDDFWSLGDAQAEILEQLGAQLREAFTTARVERVGNDSYAVLITDVSAFPTELVFSTLDELRSSFATHTNATFSAGIAVYPRDLSDRTDILFLAFEAVHKAKLQGKNRVALAPLEKMRLKTSYYRSGQLAKLALLAERTGKTEAVLLREALADLLLKYDID